MKQQHILFSRERQRDIFPRQSLPADRNNFKFVLEVVQVLFPFFEKVCSCQIFKCLKTFL